MYMVLCTDNTQIRYAVYNVYYTIYNEHFIVGVAQIFRFTILEPEILGNHNINSGTTLLLKTIVN